MIIVLIMFSKDRMPLKISQINYYSKQDSESEENKENCMTDEENDDHVSDDEEEKLYTLYTHDIIK